ncbi:MAG: peptide chain release factor N(5)-glutamine methyltransferase [Actinomycetota bacterium]
MRPAEVVRRGTEYLRRHDVENPELNAEALMQAVLDTDRAGVLARDEGLSAAEAKAYGRGLCRRCTGTPLQHLTGEQGFRYLILRVRPGVFVPRPETEVLVDAALGAIADLAKPTVVDLCTGAGPVALSLRHERPETGVWATDIAPEAVILARENAERLGLDVVVLEGDLFEPLPPELKGSLDLVTANPPYVALEEAASLPPEVRADPPLAVFGGLEMYERILPAAFSWLRPGGAVVLEIEESLGGQVSAVVRRAGFEEVDVRPDLTGRDRVVAARRP